MPNTKMMLAKTVAAIVCLLCVCMVTVSYAFSINANTLQREDKSGRQLGATDAESPVRHVVKRAAPSPAGRPTPAPIPARRPDPLDVDDAMESVTGTVFTRWGRTKCPEQSVSVYKGVMAGSNSAGIGGGTDYLCLPLKPEWSNKIRGSNSYSQLFGVEFQGSNSLYFRDNADSFINQDAPCVVCQSYFRRNQLMIPALLTCLPGWHKEYSGFLMSSKVGEKSQKNFVCLDGAPELDTEGYRADGGAKLWPVEAICGSLPCPNYETGSELTCVVCTR